MAFRPWQWGIDAGRLAPRWETLWHGGLVLGAGWNMQCATARSLLLWTVLPFFSRGTRALSAAGGRVAKPLSALRKLLCVRGYSGFSALPRRTAFRYVGQFNMITAEYLPSTSCIGIY